MPLTLQDINKTNNQAVAFFNFKKLKGNKFLITNDIGSHAFLTFDEFDSYLKGGLENFDSVKYEELKEKGFIRNQLNFPLLIKKYAKRKFFLSNGPSLHIVVVTLRCDHKCVYCQTSAKNEQSKNLDMSKETAKKVVDKIFETPNKTITIEFQGGEPLLNFETVKFIVTYANELNKQKRKNMLIALVTNLASMDEEKLKFLIKNDVSICTSIDGPQYLHNQNRIFQGKKNIYPQIKKWVGKIQSAFLNKQYKHKPQALLTVSKKTLSQPKKIVDEYLALGFDSIHLRPLSPLGLAVKTWKKIGYSADEFIDFYIKALKYIISLNKKGTFIAERAAALFIKKIFDEKDPNYLDLRSPCGAVTGQLAYNFNGDIYACDEARMLSRMGDDSFKLGNVDTPLDDMLKSEICKTLIVASTLENLPGCSDCAYNPYCGVCPIFSYVETGNVFGKPASNTRSIINRLQLDYIFELMENNETLVILKNWTEIF